MNVVILGAGGGLGRNVVEAAVDAGHRVRALVRDASRVSLPDGVEAVIGDARDHAALERAVDGASVVFFCLNPAFSRWEVDFPPLLDTAIRAARTASARLVFPANVWVFGRGVAGQTVAETAPASPVSMRGRLRARMEQALAESGVRYCMVRLPEFYGPHVVTLTGRVVAAAVAGKNTLWPGPLDCTVEFVYMPDGARAMVEAGCASDSDGITYHVPGLPTTPRRFITEVYEVAGTSPRIRSIPGWVLRGAALVNAAARGAADIGHLWTHPILLDGERYRRRFGKVPATPYTEGIAETVAWFKGTSNVRLQG